MVTPLLTPRMPLFFAAVNTTPRGNALSHHRLSTQPLLALSAASRAAVAVLPVVPNQVATPHSGARTRSVAALRVPPRGRYLVGDECPFVTGGSRTATSR
jgi:hypothetical protein